MRGGVAITVEEAAKSMLNVRWHTIDGYKDYVITECGDVYSYRYDKRGWHGFRKLAHRGKNNPKRYLTVCLSKDGKVKYIQIHRLVAKYFVDGYFDGAVVDHKNRNIHDNMYTNLEWVTQEDNIKRSYSVMDAVRNYKIWKLVSPDGTESVELKGIGEIEKYVNDNGIPVSITSLQKYKTSKGYMLKEIQRQIA